jgi:hypothetical protein
MKPYVIFVGADLESPRDTVSLPVEANPVPFHVTHLKRAHMMGENQLRYINQLSDVVLTYQPDGDNYEVRAWTNELDENEGNVKGYISVPAYNRNFPALVIPRVPGCRITIRKGVL